MMAPGSFKISPASIKLCIIGFSFIANFAISQTTHLEAEHKHSHELHLKKMLPVVPTNSFWDADSLTGFDEAVIQKEILAEHFNSENGLRYMYLQKRDYINEKYALGKYAIPEATSSNATHRGGESNSIQSLDCTTENFNFENASSTGWTLSGATTLVSAGTDPYGGFPWVYPGGSYSLRVSDDTGPPSNFGQAVKTIVVPATGTTLFTFHFAMSIFSYPHPASLAAKFKVNFYDANNILISCPNFECYHSTDNGDVGVNTFSSTPYPAIVYNIYAVGDGPASHGVTYSPWQDVTLDLTGYAGQTIKAVFRIDWCGPSPDWAYALIDADCPVFNYVPINVCLNQPLLGPSNMLSYSWTSPSGSVSTASCLTASEIGTYSLQAVPLNVQCTSAPFVNFLYKVTPAPSADFSFTATPCQTSLGIPFQQTANLNGGNPATPVYKWDWGDGTVNGTLPVDLHTYVSSGTKTVTLIVTNEGCSDSIKKSLVLTVKSSASFTSTNVCLGIPSSFSSTSSLSITSYKWEWGDATANGAGISPTHTYGTPGAFPVKLLVTNTDGCKDSVTTQTTIYPKPVVSFAASPVCFNSATTFTNNSSIILPSTISSYKWNFNDGSVNSAATAPVHTYTLGTNANSIFNVTLNATSDYGCKDSVVTPVNVYGLPVADFSSDSVCLGMTSHILYTGTGNGNALSGCSWDLTNDNLADINGPANINYISTSAGNCPVTLTVTTSPATGLACKSFTTHNIWVHHLPQAAFTYTNTCINTTPLGFDASSSTIATGTNTLFAWNFGDGASANGTATTHQYNLPLAYNVSLTVTSDRGCVHSIANQVEVYQKPLMGINASYLVCLGSSTSFTAVSLPNSGTANTWLWDVNNSINSIEANGSSISYAFPAVGTQTVQLVSITDHFCRDTTSRTVYINYNPAPQFSVDIANGCSLPHCVNFTDHTPLVPLPARIKQWSWSFGDGTQATRATNASQTNCYTNSNSNQLAFFTVTLTTTTDSSCINTTIKPNFITVYPKPIANYTVIPDFGNVVQPLVHFINQSADYTNWWWNFGDGSQIDSVNLHPDHYYISASSDTYHTVLIVANQYGCTDTAYIPVEIKPEFIFYIPNAFTPNGDNVNDFFTGMGIGIDTYEMWIFDRWGADIYHTNDIYSGWNGKTPHQNAKQDVYTWKVELKDVFGKTHSYIGHVTLIR